MQEQQPVVTTLKSANGFFLCAEGGGGDIARVDRESAGPWEQWRVHTYDDGRVSLQASDGHFLCAEPDGKVVINRSQSGEYERFTIEVRDVGVAFKSYHNTYLQAPEGGGTPALVRCVGDDPTLPGVWEFFASSVPFWESGGSNNPNRLTGNVTRDARVVSDDSGRAS